MLQLQAVIKTENSLLYRNKHTTFSFPHSRTDCGTANSGAMFFLPWLISQVKNKHSFIVNFVTTTTHIASFKIMPSIPL